MSDVEQLDPKYEVVRKLREGGMGTIYLVRHRLLEELRVIKVLRAQMSSDADLEERFAREAKTAIQLRHPNIAQLYDFSIDPTGVAYIVMEYIDGVTLDEYRRARPSIDLPETLAIAIQALRALAFLHRKGYVHRDISPDNLMLTRDADGHSLVKLIDLGIVKILREDSQATATLHYLGKPRYSSPEQFSSTAVDARSDLYSFGIMLYELVTGRHPVSGGDLPAIVTGHLYLPPLDFETSDPEGRIPASLRALILESLAKQPEGRPQSAEAFGRRLSEIQRELARSAAAASERKALQAEDTQPFRQPEAREVAISGDPAANSAANSADDFEGQTVVKPPRVAVPPAPAEMPRTPSGARSPFLAWSIGIAVAAIGLFVAIGFVWFRARGARIPEEYTRGVAALEENRPLAAIPLLRAAAGRDPIEHDGYLPFFRLGIALASSGDCDAAEVAFATSTGQSAVGRNSEASAALEAARAACAAKVLEPELVEFEAQVGALEAQVKALERDRSDRNLAELWRDPELERELDRVASLLRESRALVASARQKRSREPLFTAQDRFADAQLALGALLKKIAAR